MAVDVIGRLRYNVRVAIGTRNVTNVTKDGHFDDVLEEFAGHVREDIGTSGMNIDEIRNATGSHNLVVSTTIPAAARVSHAEIAHGGQGLVGLFVVPKQRLGRYIERNRMKIKKLWKEFGVDLSGRCPERDGILQGAIFAVTGSTKGGWGPLVGLDIWRIGSICSTCF